MSRDGYSYIGRCKCGEILCAIVDEPDMKTEIAEELPKWIKWGYTIERVTDAYVREHLSLKCNCERQATLL